MMSNESESSEPHYMTAEQLYIGVFVMLELPWFLHSFALNHFKICTHEQLHDVRALRLERFRYDPARSDSPPDAPSQAEDKPPPYTPDHLLPGTSDTLATNVVASFDVDQKSQRMVLIQQYRQKVEQIEKAFSKAVSIMKRVNHDITTRPRETLQEMGLLVGDMADAFLNSPDATLLVMGDKAGGEDIYFHSLNVTILAMMLARELNFSKEQAREMGIGAMLHDIGLTEIPDRIAKKSASESTQAERNLRAMHVGIGIDIGRRIGLSAQALAVVAQHHEYVDGSGYPKGITGAGMTAAARLVCLVNFYDNLCNPHDISQAMTPHEALSYMFAQTRSKFEFSTLQLLIRSLGIHPPGSILQLSNQSLAVVTSVNPNKPLRPWVLVYDDNVPKDEAMSINLETEPTISIIKSIRPAQLPPKVAAYLSPRKRVTYFFDAYPAANTSEQTDI